MITRYDISITRNISNYNIYVHIYEINIDILICVWKWWVESLGQSLALAYVN